LLAANSEFALAEADGKLYLLGGYPSSRQAVRTVQIYDIASDRWELGPPLPHPNNHGMAASVHGKVYLIGGQTTADGHAYVDTVYELDVARGTWVEKARMPTARSSGVAVVRGGKIYVAGGHFPRGRDFAVYEPAADRWEVLPNLPTPRDHIAGAVINGRIHVVGGRPQTAAHEVYDPETRTWSTAAPMLRARSGINGVMARGCFHVWGGEDPAIGMNPDHDYYDPRTDRWTRLRDMPIPVHGVTGSAFVHGLIWVSGGGTSVGGNFGSLHNQVFRPTVSCE
jgi:N-acetylneuraminic acid mutarotase